MYIMDVHCVKNQQDSSHEPPVSFETPWMTLWRTQELEHLLKRICLGVCPAFTQDVHPTYGHSDKLVDMEDKVVDIVHMMDMLKMRMMIIMIIMRMKSDLPYTPLTILFLIVDPLLTTTHSSFSSILPLLLFWPTPFLHLLAFLHLLLPLKFVIGSFNRCFNL
jgi:hypothetical protein